MRDAFLPDLMKVTRICLRAIKSVLGLVSITLLMSQASLARGGDLTPVCLELDDGLKRGCGFAPRFVSQCEEHSAPFYKESCIFEHESELISEIVSIPFETLDLEKLPRWSTSPTARAGQARQYAKDRQFPEISPEIFLAHPLDQILKSVIYRLYLERDLKAIRAHLSETPREKWSTLRSMYDEVVPQISFSLAVAPLIAKNGFLNLHQVGSSNGFNYPEARQVSEENLLGFGIGKSLHHELPEISSAAATLLPKYGYAGIAPGTPGITTSFRYDSFYGSVMAQLKPSVLHYSTITLSDSLLGAPENLKSVHRHHIGHHTARILYEPGESYSTGSYAELQIFGPLAAEAVDLLMIDCHEVSKRIRRKKSRQQPITLGEIRGLGNLFDADVHTCDPILRSKNGELTKLKKIPASQRWDSQLRVAPGVRIEL